MSWLIRTVSSSCRGNSNPLSSPHSRPMKSTLTNTRFASPPIRIPKSSSRIARRCAALQLKDSREISSFPSRYPGMCTAGLQDNDLLSGKKKSLLTKFSRKDVLLDLMADVLNMLFAGLPNRIWDAPESVPVSPGRPLNGKYGAMTDGDVLQTILFHYIGIR